MRYTDTKVVGLVDVVTVKRMAAKAMTIVKGIEQQNSDQEIM